MHLYYKDITGITGKSWKITVFIGKKLNIQKVGNIRKKKETEREGKKLV